MGAIAAVWGRVRGGGATRPGGVGSRRPPALDAHLLQTKPPANFTLDSFNGKVCVWSLCPPSARGGVCHDGLGGTLAPGDCLVSPGHALPLAFLPPPKPGVPPADTSSGTRVQTSLAVRASLPPPRGFDAVGPWWFFEPTDYVGRGELRECAPEMSGEGGSRYLSDPRCVRNGTVDEVAAACDDIKGCGEGDGAGRGCAGCGCGAAPLPPRPTLHLTFSNTAH